MKRMLCLSILLLACAAFAQSRVAGYFPYWAQYSQFTPDDVRYNFLTEVRYGYLTPEASNLAFAGEDDKGNFSNLVKNAKAAKIKVIAAVGGIGAESAMQEAYASEESRKALANSAKSFATEYGVDGFELDGGAMAASDLSKLIALATEFANAGLLVSIAVVGEGSMASAFSGADFGKIDAVSLWFTDGASAKDEAVKPNSNTAENEKVLAAFASAGVPKEKLFPIVPFYGKTFSEANGLGSAHKGSGSGNEGALPYKEILDKFQGTKYAVSFDDASKSEVAVSPDETIVFNGIPSMKEMAEKVKANGYGGIAAFDLSGDHKEPVVSILVTIGQVLRPDVDYKSKKKR
jgi:GH18 family chitinase